MVLAYYSLLETASTMVTWELNLGRHLIGKVQNVTVNKVT